MKSVPTILLSLASPVMMIASLRLMGTNNHVQSDGQQHEQRRH
ncbi:MAG: hypothetical protein ABIQ73_10775 [Acidimicrobiales bacterium]